MQKREYKTGKELTAKQWKSLQPLFSKPIQSPKGGPKRALNRVFFIQRYSQSAILVNSSRESLPSWERLFGKVIRRRERGFAFITICIYSKFHLYRTS